MRAAVVRTVGAAKAKAKFAASLHKKEGDANRGVTSRVVSPPPKKGGGEVRESSTAAKGKVDADKSFASPVALAAVGGGQRERRATFNGGVDPHGAQDTDTSMLMRPAAAEPACPPPQGSGTRESTTPDAPSPASSSSVQHCPLSVESTGGAGLSGTSGTIDGGSDCQKAMPTIEESPGHTLHEGKHASFRASTAEISCKRAISASVSKSDARKPSAASTPSSSPRGPKRTSAPKYSLPSDHHAAVSPRTAFQQQKSSNLGGKRRPEPCAADITIPLLDEVAVGEVLAEDASPRLEGVSAALGERRESLAALSARTAADNSELREALAAAEARAEQISEASAATVEHAEQRANKLQKELEEMRRAGFIASLQTQRSQNQLSREKRQAMQALSELEREVENFDQLEEDHALLEQKYLALLDETKQERLPYEEVRASCFEEVKTANAQAVVLHWKSLVVQQNLANFNKVSLLRLRCRKVMFDPCKELSSLYKKAPVTPDTMKVLSPGFLIAPEEWRARGQYVPRSAPECLVWGGNALLDACTREVVPRQLHECQEVTHFVECCNHLPRTQFTKVLQEALNTVPDKFRPVGFGDWAKESYFEMCSWADGR